VHNLCVFLLVIQEPEQFADTPEIPFSPSIFFSSPEEQDFYDPYYKPPQ